MNRSIVTGTTIHLDDRLFEKFSHSHVELAKYLGKSAPEWLPSWFESVLLPSGQYDVCADKLRPARTEYLKALKQDRDLNCRALQAAHDSSDEPTIKKLALKADQIETKISSISRTNGKAKSGPNKGAITSKYLMAARLVEVYLVVKGKEPSPRNPKLAAMLVSLLDTLGIFRRPIGNRLNGVRKAFEVALSVSNKVNDPELRKHDALHDEIVLARLHTRRSLEQCEMRGRAPWSFPGMNGPVRIYDPKTEI